MGGAHVACARSYQSTATGFSIFAPDVCQPELISRYLASLLLARKLRWQNHECAQAQRTRQCSASVMHGGPQAIATLRSSKMHCASNVRYCSEKIRTAKLITALGVVDIIPVHHHALPDGVRKPRAPLTPSKLTKDLKARAQSIDFISIRQKNTL